MNIFHTLIIKVASAITAVLLFVGVGTPTVTVVDVQDSGVTVTTATSTQQEPSQMASVSVSATVLPPEKATTPTEPTPVAPVVTVAPEATPTVQVTQVTPTQAISVPVYIIQLVTTPEPTPQPQPVATVSAPQVMQTPTFEVKNPLPGKGLGRTLKWRATPIDELNEVDLGAVLTNPDGSINSTSVVTVTATDETQNKTLNGTGNTSTFGDPNNPKMYYPFSYYIKTPGLHKITFTSDLGVSVDVSINVTDEDTR